MIPFFLKYHQVRMFTKETNRNRSTPTFSITKTSRAAHQSRYVCHKSTEMKRVFSFRDQ